MLLRQQTNSTRQGNVGVGSAISWFTLKGYTVSIPLTDSQDYDLVVDIDGSLKKVQVKTTYHKPKKHYEVNLRVSSAKAIKHFDNKKVDYVFALTESGERYLIPSENIQSRKCISLGSKYMEFKV